MNKKIVLLSLIVLFCNLSFSQDYINISLKNLELMDERLNNFTISINGQEIDFTKKVTKVLISSKKKLDTVVLSYNSRTRITYAKFQKSVNYILSINPCSAYTLYPEREMKTGSFSVVKNKVKKKVVLSFCSFDYELEKGISYLNERCMASAMCFFSSQEIAIKQDEEVIDSFNFHFLHGENLLLKVYKNKLRFKLD